MKTDYKNLNLPEVMAVFFAVAGIALIGAIGFAVLPVRHQASVISAAQMFDMHEQLSAQAEGFKFFAYDLPQDFLGEFYAAFSEVAVIPYETVLSWQELRQDTLVFSEKVASAYEKDFLHENQTTVALFRVGKVSGVSVTAAPENETPPVMLLENIVPPEVKDFEVSEDLRGRGYEPPEIKKFFEQTLMLMEEQGS